MKYKMSTKFLISTAMCIALSVALRTVAIMITAGGIAIMKMSFSAIFYIIPGLLFGPLYGALAGGITDILSAIMTPQGGAYIPVFTLTNMLAGFLPALIWKKIKGVSIISLKKCYITFFSLITLLGIVNYMIINVLHKFSKVGILLALGKKAQYLSIGFIIVSILGFSLLIINEFIEKKSKMHYEYVYDNFFKLITSVGTSGIIVSTLDTCFILVFTPALLSKGFMVLWIPRIVETLIMTVINSYALSVLIYLYGLVEKRVISKA